MRREKYRWGQQSRGCLAMLDPGMHLALDIVLHMGIMDLTVACTFRDEISQNKAFDQKKSEKKWPDSRHNVLNRHGFVDAVDVYPFLDGHAHYDKNQCAVMVGAIMAVGGIMGVEMTSGINWDRDGEWVTDHRLHDYGHLEKFIPGGGMDPSRKNAIEAIRRQGLVHEYLLDMITEGKGAQDALFFGKIREEMDAIYNRNRFFFGGGAK